MKIFIALLLALSSSFLFASTVVFVETTLDTDNDGKRDLIYTSIKKPNGKNNLSTIFKVSPYSQGGNSAVFHNVNVKELPQNMPRVDKSIEINLDDLSAKYAHIKSDSIGTGRSTGCPSVGGYSEALAAKSVIDWLNDRARAFDSNGNEVKATWSNGRVGMVGVSYDGTLPTMVATTGVEGLKAIVPIAAISNWYDYYRANGLVVGPGGYVGEDIDTLGMYIVRKNKCKKAIYDLRKQMGRETGDYTKFWQKRNYVSIANRIKAATFIIHGQSDWNVKQKHAIDLWNALDGVVPRRMHLHSGGHRSAVPKQISAWFDYHLYGIKNDILEGSSIEVTMNNGKTIKQDKWPHEQTTKQRFYFNSDQSLGFNQSGGHYSTIIDMGKKITMKNLMKNPLQLDNKRLVFLGPIGRNQVLFSGTPRLRLNLSVLNKRAANISVYIIEYKKNGSTELITKGWVDPQNHNCFSKGELLTPGQSYQVDFKLEPKQYLLSVGSRLGVMIASTDYHYTIRPDTGTEIEFAFGGNSFIDLNLSR